MAAKKTKTKKHVEINPMMHYTVFIALIISMITTFLLGIVLTETLVNSGYSYFDEIAEQGKAARRASAAVRQPVVREKKQQNVQFNGNVGYLTTGTMDSSIIPQTDDQPGTNMTGLFKYDVNAPNKSTSSDLASYHSDGTIQLSAGNYDFKVAGFDINVWNDYQRDPNPFDPFPIIDPPFDNLDVIVQRFTDDGLFIDLLVVRLWDSTGTALHSDALPQLINLNDWEYVSVSAQGFLDPNSPHGHGFWSFGGPVTKLNW